MASPTPLEPCLGELSIHTCIHTYIRAITHTHIIYIYMYTHIHIHLHIHIHTRHIIHVTHIQWPMWRFREGCVDTYAYMYVYTYTLMHLCNYVHRFIDISFWILVTGAYFSFPLRVCSVLTANCTCVPCSSYSQWIPSLCVRNRCGLFHSVC